MENQSNQSFNVLIATGGTGGHVFPAQALGRQLLEKNHNVLFMGKGLSSNSYFAKHLFRSESIDSATPFKKGMLQKLLSLFSLIKGTLQAFSLIGKYKPNLVVGFGSFHSFPVLAAAFLRRVPIVLFESNSVPGKVNQIFSRFSQFSGIQFPQAKELLKGPCFEVEMPFWREKGNGERLKERRDYFSLDENLFTVLVFGGSQGASFINMVVADTLKQFHEKGKKVQVIHMTGSLPSAEEVQSFYVENDMKASVKPFEEKMHLAWKSADMVICRAGAATLAEVIEFEVPAILIPFPKAADNHQLKNALFFQEEVRGGFCLEEKKLTPKDLLSLLQSCDISTLKESIAAFKKSAAKKQLIDRIEEFLYSKGKA